MSFRRFLRVGAVPVLFLFLSLSLSLSACSGTKVGQSCTADDECGEFKCLHDQKAATGGGCTNATVPPTGTCSPACRTHADCTPYGATFKCALAQSDVACNPTGVCLDDYSITCTPGPCRLAPAN